MKKILFYLCLSLNVISINAFAFNVGDRVKYVNPNSTVQHAKPATVTAIGQGTLTVRLSDSGEEIQAPEGHFIVQIAGEVGDSSSGAIPSSAALTNIVDLVDQLPVVISNSTTGQKSRCANEAVGVPNEKPSISEWLHRANGSFLSHAVQPKNLDFVLRDKRLLPAELILRTKGSVEREDDGWGTYRTTSSVSAEEVEHFKKDFEALPPICKGIAFIKVTKTSDGNYHLYFGESEVPEEGKLLFEGDEKSFFGFKNRFLYSLDSHFEYLAGQGQSIRKVLKDNGFSSIQVPTLNCGIFEKEAIIRISKELAGRRDSFGKDSEFQARLAEIREKVRAKRNTFFTDNFTPLAHVVDEALGRPVEKSLKDAYSLYEPAILKFFSNYHQAIGLLGEDLEEQKKWTLFVAQGSLDAYRLEYFGNTKLSDQISFGPNKIYGTYGSTSILIGNPEGKDNLRFEHFSSNEFRTNGIMKNGGKFDTVDLTDPNVVILGPKAELEHYKSMYPEINIIFREDLPVEIQETFREYNFLEDY
jgi:hypothetical protein